MNCRQFYYLCSMSIQLICLLLATPTTTLPIHNTTTTHDNTTLHDVETDKIDQTIVGDLNIHMQDGGNNNKRKKLKMLKRILRKFGKVLKHKVEVEMEKENSEHKTIHLSVAIKTDDRLRHAGDSSIYRKDDEKNERIFNKFGKIVNKRTRAKKQYFRVL